MKDRGILRRYLTPLWIVAFLAGGVTFGSGLVLAPTAQAQEAKDEGRVKNPSINPWNPDLIMYERIPLDARDIQELYLFNVRTQSFDHVELSQTTGGQIQDAFDPMDIGAQEFSLYEGEIAWRPCLDASERQWFAYVGSSSATGGLDLFLSFVDSQGRLSSETPVHIPHEGAVQTPQWSPDCQSLIFVSGSQATTQIYWIEDVSEILKRRRGDTVRPVPVTEALTLKIYPAWSPDGRYIAYQTQVESGGLVNWQVHAIRLDEYRPGQRPRPIFMTSELDEFHEYRPSWSPDGGYLAFYVSQSKVGDDTVNLLQDIGVVAVFRDDAGRITGSSLLSYLSPRLTTNVIPNRGRGPVWSPSEEGRGIIYVKRDEANYNPIYFADLGVWTNMKTNHERSLSDTLGFNFDTVFHRDPFVVATPTGIRVAYIAQERDVNKVHVRTIPLPNTNRTIWVRVELAQSKAFTRSLLFPGSGQIYRGGRQKSRGWIFGAAFALSVGAALYFDSQVKSDDVQQFEDAYCATSTTCQNEQYAQWQDAYDSAKNNQTLARGAIAAAVLIWGINVLESRNGFPRFARRPLRMNTTDFQVKAAQPHMDYIQGEPHYGFRLQVSF